VWRDVRVVFFGDSITEGVVEASYLALLANRVSADSRMRGLELINAGVGGDTVINLARRMERDVLAQSPEWVVIFIGINDCTTALRRHAFPVPSTLRHWSYFRDVKQLYGAVTPQRYLDGLRVLVDGIARRSSARIALCTPATIGESVRSHAWRMLDGYAETVRQVAAERDCHLIDVHAAFSRAIAQLPAPAPVTRIARGIAGALRGEPSGVTPLLGYRLTRDGIHLSQDGATLVADMLYDWLLRVCDEVATSSDADAVS